MALSSPQRQAQSSRGQRQLARSKSAAEIQQLLDDRSNAAVGTSCLHHSSPIPSLPISLQEQPQTPNGHPETRRPLPQSPPDTAMHTHQPLNSSESRMNESADNYSALFTLQVDESTQLATVRPQHGSLLLVESMSASKVVLRLQPPTSPAVSSPPVTSAVPASSSPPDRQILPRRAQHDGERSRASITQEQLSAAQLAVQRSLRGLTGADSLRPHGAGTPSGHEDRCLKRASAPSGSWVAPHDRRAALDHPSGFGRSLGENSRPPSSATTWSSGRSSPTESTWTNKAGEGGAPLQVRLQPRRGRALTTEDHRMERSSAGTQDINMPGGEESLRSRRPSVPASAFLDGSGTEAGVAYRRRSSDSPGPPSEKGPAGQSSLTCPHHQPGPPLPPARQHGAGIASNSGSAAHHGSLLYQQTASAGAPSIMDATMEEGTTAGRAPLYCHQSLALPRDGIPRQLPRSHSQAPPGRQSPIGPRSRALSRHSALPPSASDLTRAAGGGHMADTDFVAMFPPKAMTHDTNLRNEMMAPANPVMHGTFEFRNDQYSKRPDHAGRPRYEPGISPRGGHQSVPNRPIDNFSAAANDRTPSAPASCLQIGAPAVTDDAATAVAQWSSLRVTPSPAPPGICAPAGQSHFQGAERGRLQEPSLRLEDSQVVRQITTEIMEGGAMEYPHHPPMFNACPTQSAYSNDQHHKQQAVHGVGPNANNPAMSVGGSASSWGPSSAHALFYPLPVGSDQSTRLSHTAMFDGSGGAHEGVYFPPTVPAFQGASRPASAAPCPPHLAAMHSGNKGHQSPQPHHYNNRQQQQQVGVAVRAGGTWESMPPNGRLVDGPLQSARRHMPLQPLAPLPWAPPGIRRASEPVYSPDGVLLQLGGGGGGVPVEMLDGLGERAFSAESAPSTGRGAQLSAMHNMSMLGEQSNSAPISAQINTTVTGEMQTLRSLRDSPTVISSDTRGTHHTTTSSPQLPPSIVASESFDSLIPSPYRPPASMFSFLDGDDS